MRVKVNDFWVQLNTADCLDDLLTLQRDLMDSNIPIDDFNELMMAVSYNVREEYRNLRA